MSVDSNIEDTTSLRRLRSNRLLARQLKNKAVNRVENTMQMDKALAN